MSRMAVVNQGGKALPVLYDRWLLLAIVALMLCGLLMVATTSITISYRLYGMPFHYVVRQAIFLSVGIGLGLIVLRIEMSLWYRMSLPFLIVTLVLLIAVLIPGIGKQVNGSMRWIGFGPIGMQVSEIAKISVIIYLSSYVVRYRMQVQQDIQGFIKPMILVGFIALLLLKEPDFGAATVIITTVLGILFLAGVPLSQFLILISIVAVGLGVLAISSPYRMQRLTSFLNPWEHAYQSGYQLTQSLIAFGRGGWFGVGLGESVQKLFYLPEAHTDFIFAVTAEELGLVGSSVLIGIFSLLVGRALLIAKKAQQVGENFSGFVAYGIALWVGLQVLINIGVNAGILPTKGLTLPLLSYGGSSLIMMCVTMAILVRIDHETRLREHGFSKSRWYKR